MWNSGLQGDEQVCGKRCFFRRERWEVWEFEGEGRVGMLSYLYSEPISGHCSCIIANGMSYSWASAITALA